MKQEALREFLAGPPRRIHLIGVSGSGMSGIAGLLLALGHRVSGSDRAETAEVRLLERRGLSFAMPHRAAQVRDAELVVYSSAVRAGNCAFDEAQRLCLPMCRRAEALAALMTMKRGIVVAGMHGKTTTASMAAHVLRVAGLKPSHYVGAEIPILGANARWDSEGEYFVAEGDESDGTLVNYHPAHCMVLNIEPEHLDFYRDLEAIDAVYRRLAEQTSGIVLYCADDAGAARVCGELRGAVAYGASPAARYRMEELVLADFRPSFRVLCDGTELGCARLNVPGAHNAMNALAVIALAQELGVPFEETARALESFRGARRRFEIKYGDTANLVVDDYGHHPTEIAATLATARQGGWKRVLVMFQPHRFTRTAALREEFGRTLAEADLAVVSDVYAASEPPIEGISGGTIVEAVCACGGKAQYEPAVRRVAEALGPHIRDGDLILSLGAGNIHESTTRLAADLELRQKLLEVMGPGLVRLYEPLSRHTTLRVGGPAQFWVEPETEAGFAELVRHCFEQNIPFMVMGRGSNLLVRDGGIPGVVAHLARGEFCRHSIEGAEITAGVGLKLKQLVAVARNAGLAGFEWMEGIPGSLGGALRMNAGAMGWQTFDQVRRVRFCDQSGNLFALAPDEMEVRYRNVPMLAKNYALSATLEGRPAPVGDIESGIRAFEAKRKSSQPVAASAGCIFKNPGELPAGMLVEELGFKNFSIGGARVSPVHGNFIVNEGGATANDVLAIIGEIRAAAERERGIRLETEVQIVGEEA